MVAFKLVRRNLAKHWGRSGLTIASLVVALFLVCMLRSLLYSLERGVRGAKRDRLVVQSAVSLFVNLPIHYQSKMAQVAGVENTCKFHWFGGYYQDKKNFFAQFAVDPEPLFAMYPEMHVVEGSKEAFLADPQGCVVGDTLAKKFHWKIGDAIPLVGIVYPAEPGQTWSFNLRAVFHSTSSAFDPSTMFFQWDYFQKTLEAQKNGVPPEVATYSIRTAPGADQTAVARAVEERFEKGDQRVNCVSEAVFSAQFLTMMGNIPFFVAAIGGGALVAILFACVNTMLMAAREQRRDVGILKALGFTDGAVGGFMLAQSLLLCGTGGALGILLAKGTERSFNQMLDSTFPGYELSNETLGLAVAITLGVGLLAGIVPFLGARRLACVAALRSEE